MNDMVLEQTAMRCLVDNLGIVQTERFISLIRKDPFDYTKWQQDLWSGKSVDEIFNAAARWKQSEPDE
jgi:hypothetical protein